MGTAKNGLARRAFQDVPRELRRRTASHNPHRVPKRLRVRARQEAKEDNTPITRGTSGSGIGKGKKKFLRKEGIEKSRQKWEERAKRRKENKKVDATAAVSKDEDGDVDMADAIKPTKKTKAQTKTTRKFPALATPATPPSRFRRRQRDKTWLPTHIWHTKRSRMTDPKDPLWRFAIPLQPVVKAYRLTHRAATERGAVAWDMSYMSTISLEGPEASIIGLLKGLHLGIDGREDPWQDRGRAKKWRHGTRTWEGWICEREARPPQKIAQATVIWSIPEEGKARRKVFVRTHPQAFLQLWNEIVKISKVQKPAVIVQDLRFEIGSIEIIGPGAAETLCSILSPVTAANADSNSPQVLWPTFASITDAASLPAGALLAFEVPDPRFSDPPSQSRVAQDEQSLASLTDILALWPIDNTQSTPSIFDRNARMIAARSLLSQKTINRRKSACTLGETPESKPTDAKIPVLLFVSRENKSWTVMLPWKCVMPVWRGITRYPLSTGGNPRFGGLKERRQVDYERSRPHFPYDHPGTAPGWDWELREREARKYEWTRRPKGKRIEWSTIDLGNGRKGEIGDPWACEWERLRPVNEATDKASKKDVERTQTSFQQLSSSRAADIVSRRSTVDDYLQTPFVFTVKISMVHRGTPTACARIYQLPANDPERRKEWLSLLPIPNSQRTPKKQGLGKTHPSERLSHRGLARSLLEPIRRGDEPAKAGEEDYPLVPDEEDLIGFVTTGNYNLSEGRPTGVANLVLDRVASLKGGPEAASSESRVCIVRQAGSNIGRLARWEVV